MATALALTFHGVSPALLPPNLRSDSAVLRYTLTRENLHRILDQVGSESCRTAAGLEGGSGGNFTVITIDDGCRSDFEEVFPALMSRGLKATFFVTSNHVGVDGYVTWDQLGLMNSAGMEIGSHGLTHSILVTLKPEEAVQEIRRSKEILERRLGRAVVSYAPVGGHYERWMIDEALSAGYRVFATMVPGRTALRPGTVLLRRNHVQAHHSASHLRRLLQGEARTLLASRARYELLGATRRVLGMRGYERLKSFLLRRANS